MELTLEDIKKELQDYFANQTIIDEYEKNNGKIEELYERATKITATINDIILILWRLIIKIISFENIFSWLILHIL